MITLLDSFNLEHGTTIFAINHPYRHAFSVVIPQSDHTFEYLGYYKSPFSIPVGEKVVVFDDEGDKHEITRLT